MRVDSSRRIEGTEDRDGRSPLTLEVAQMTWLRVMAETPHGRFGAFRCDVCGAVTFVTTNTKPCRHPLTREPEPMRPR